MDFGISPEQDAWLADVRAFVAGRVAPRAAEIDREAAYPRDLVVEAGRLGLLAATVPVALGGAGRDYLSYALAVEAVALGSATLSVILTVANSLVAEPLVEFGSPAQQQTWLPALARGEAIGAFALSEAQSGSDAADQRTVAQADGRGWRLTGRKVWVANAEAADVVLVFARTDPGERSRGISAFLVPLAGLAGVTRTASDSLGVRGLGCMDLEFADVRLGPDALIGERGRGFRLAMRALEGGRVAIAAQALGVGQAALAEAVAYAGTRSAFGQPIGEFQALQFQIADLATDLEAARMLMWRAADARQRAPRASVEAAMAKLAASEAAHRAADRAMQILASEGYRRGSTIERLFRDVRAAEIYQGTSEVQRMIVAESLI